MTKILLEIKNNCIKQGYIGIFGFFYIQLNYKCNIRSKKFNALESGVLESFCFSIFLLLIIGFFPVCP
jgi:hypothetical protein